MSEKKEVDEQKTDTADIVDVAPLLDRDPVELADDKPALETVVKYLRKQRENIEEAAQAGKKATAKARTKGVDKKDKPKEHVNILDQLVGDKK